jgi:hypothetical protein
VGREYTLGESLTEGKWAFDGQTARSPEVAAAMEREGREGRKKGGEGRKVRPKHYAPEVC